MDASVELVKHLLPSVVHIHAVVARDHPSTQILGNDRLGSGVVVDASGLILSVNYVVMGAQAIEVAFAKGRRTRAEIVAQDFEVGLALLKVKRQGLPAAVLTGDALEPGNAVIALASTGTQERRVGGGLVIFIGEFEAYWEYLLDRSIVASAPNPGFGGGGLFTLTGAMGGGLSLNLNEIARSSLRSGERRGGEEWRSRGWAYHLKKKKNKKRCFIEYIVCDRVSYAEKKKYCDMCSRGHLYAYYLAREMCLQCLLRIQQSAVT